MKVKEDYFVVVSSPLDDLCIYIWISVMMITPITKKRGTAMYYCCCDTYFDDTVSTENAALERSNVNIETRTRISKVKANITAMMVVIE